MWRLHRRTREAWTWLLRGEGFDFDEAQFLTSSPMGSAFGVTFFFFDQSQVMKISLDVPFCKFIVFTFRHTNHFVLIFVLDIRLA